MTKWTVELERQVMRRTRRQNTATRTAPAQPSWWWSVPVALGMMAIVIASIITHS